MQEKTAESIISHIITLKKHILFAFVYVSASSIVCYCYSDAIIEFISHFLLKNVNLLFTELSSVFTLKMNIAIIVGILAVLPIISWHILMYILPALKPQERSIAVWLAVLFPALFFMGISLGFFFLLPLAVDFFLSFSISGTYAFVAEKFFSLVFEVCIFSGLVFNIPSLMIILIKFGIVSVSFLQKMRRYAIVASFIIGGIITPPDVTSQIVVSVIMILLYEVTILFAKLCCKDTK